jgi:hypothetical protein
MFREEMRKAESIRQMQKLWTNLVKVMLSSCFLDDNMDEIYSSVVRVMENILEFNKLCEEE